MNVQEYIENMRKLQANLLIFIENEDNNEENFENIIQIIDDHKIRFNTHEMKILLYIINQISNQHRRYPHFFQKIENIINELKNEIQNYYSNIEIFDIFHENKRILLFLIEKKLISIDENILEEMMKIENQNKKNLEYFAPEIKLFIEKEIGRNEKGKSYETIYEKIEEILKEQIENFNQKRLKGENEKLICIIIQNDLIDEFIEYVKEGNYSLKSLIEPSIFETNSYLLNQSNVTLIEYSCFFGSNEIFKYLYKNGIDLTPSLWLYAIHGNNKEIIQILEDNTKDLNDDNNESNLKDLYEKCFIESIKCHHKDFSNYFELYIHKKQGFNLSILSCIFNFYNFLYIPKKMEKQYLLKRIFMYACEYDYYILVELLLKTKNIDVYEMTILNNIVFLIRKKS